MTRSAGKYAAFSLVVLCAVATARDGDVRVLLPYIVSANGESRTEYRSGVVRARSANERVAVPVNDRSIIEVSLPGPFVLDAPGDPRDGKVLSEAQYRRLRTLRDRFVSAAPSSERVFAAHRSTGGFSAATVTGIIFDFDGASLPGRLDLGLYVSFSDFRRTGGESRGDPILGPNGFDTVTYIKPLRIIAIEDEGSPTPRIRIRGNGGVPHDFEPMRLPRPGEVPEPRKQRFVLDFGSHPFFDSPRFPEVTDPQLLYRVYVARVEGSDAIVVRPDSLRALERAKAGELVAVNFYRVPVSLLRVAPSGVDGDQLLQQAGLDFLRDEGIARTLPGETGMDAFFRANRWHGGTVATLAGTNLADSMDSLRQSFDRESLRRMRGSSGRCGDAIGDLGAS